ncbi:MAG: hypothetical protein IJ023_07810 [Bacteroidales bacterium]|nr:hypothetical protein [Bacteroidales bacterium]
MKSNIIMLLMACMVVCLGTEGAIAQDPSEAATPIEKLIVRYSDVKGARDFIAVGGKMALARSLIRATPMAAIAGEVDELAVLKMGNVPEGERKQFESDLHDALKGYRYHGQEQSKNGLVDVYLLMADDDEVEEVVIYNPEIFSLNSLKGLFSVKSLLSIEADD